MCKLLVTLDLQAELWTELKPWQVLVEAWRYDMTHISRYITLFVLVFAMFGCIVSECCRVVDLALGKFCARGSCPKEPTGKAGGQTSIQTCDAGHSKAGCFRCPGSWVIDVLTMLSLTDLR